MAPGGGLVSRCAMASAPPETSSTASPAPTRTSPKSCLLTASSSTTRIGDSDATLTRAYHRAARGLVSRVDRWGPGPADSRAGPGHFAARGWWVVRVEVARYRFFAVSDGDREEHGLHDVEELDDDVIVAQETGVHAPAAR